MTSHRDLYLDLHRSMAPDLEHLTVPDHNHVEQHYGWRVKTVGRWYVDIIEMGFNYRVTLTDTGSWDLLGGMSGYNYGWCFPRSVGLHHIIVWVEDWEFDPDHPGHPNHPPGEWIKDVNTQRYRVPGIGQKGPQDE